MLEPVIKRSGEIHSWELKKQSGHVKVFSGNNLDENVLNFVPVRETASLERAFDYVSSLSTDITDTSFVTVNIGDDGADYILNNPVMMKFLLQHAFLRLSIDSEFSEFMPNSPMIRLRRLSQICPLWIDDFGEGSTNLTLLSRLPFEYIKIAPSFFNKHLNTHSLRHIVSHASLSCHGAIVRGVNNEEQLKACWAAGAIAGQGDYWQTQQIKT
ncbi:EAL domain-containing protein [Trabulsiella odontotermitis]|uniref:EAL domain-containing protein n=1 Tax=Trabulsiella odontotermitis TaxID=379893 RepID=UPI003ACADAAF